MKKLFYLLFLASFIFIACDKDDVKPVKPDPPPPPPPPDTAWVEISVKVNIVYQHQRWDVTSCYIAVCTEQKIVSTFEEYLAWQSKLTDVEKSWRYEKDKAREHIGKKRYVFIEVNGWIPGTSQGCAGVFWVEVDVKHGKNHVEVTYTTPP